MPSTSIVRYFPASIISLEHFDDYRTSFSLREEKIALAIMEKQFCKNNWSCKEKEKQTIEMYLEPLEHQMLRQPSVCSQFSFPHIEDKMLPSIPIDWAERNSNGVCDIQSNPDVVSPEDVLILAKRAVIQSKTAAYLAEKANFPVNCRQSQTLGLMNNSSINDSLSKDCTIRSNRHLERKLKKRKTSKFTKLVSYEARKDVDLSKKIPKVSEKKDPLGLFLWGPETKQLLTIQEEKDLFAQIEDFTRLHEVKQRLSIEFNREPIFSEWAQAVGMSCHDLQTSLHSGNHSRQKVAYANFLLVVHVAKQYEGKGLDILDLLQEGSMGLLKSLEKFKPKGGCRFSSYAYWWIRQSIRKAIFQKSRTIRLPENVYALITKMKDARNMLHMKEGRLPSNQELAKHVGISLEKLEILLATYKNPISLQRQAWSDQDTTIQEITADLAIEAPDISFARQMMRQHLRVLLGVLDHRERKIIQLRYGIYGGEEKSLSEVGNVFGLSKERVRQLERRALEKLKDCLPAQGLKAYSELLI